MVSPAPPPVTVLRDRVSRLIGIPAFGLVIPHAVGLFAHLRPAQGMFWVGVLWFLALAWSIWEGNRWLLFRQRERLDWFEQPFYKLLALVFACTFYTAPLTLGAIWLWYRVASLPLDTAALREVTLTNVICVLFVTHAYETVFLIKGRVTDARKLAEMEAVAVRAQLDALRRQVDPHFLFNSLNTLAALIESNPQRAAQFNGALAEVYRYLLEDRPLVDLKLELDFVEAYAVLLRLRYGTALTVTLPSAVPTQGLVPPTAVQCLVENAVKHTRFNKDAPLVIHAEIDKEWIVVRNPRRPTPDVASSGLGLRNLDERCRLLVGQRLRVEQQTEEFVVHLPIGGVQL